MLDYYCFTTIIMSKNGASSYGSCCGVSRIRTDDLRLAKPALYQLSYNPGRYLKSVGLGGVEPPTSRLSGVRSNHLSYSPVRPAVITSPKNDDLVLDEREI